MERPTELQTRRLMNYVVSKIEVTQDGVTVYGYFVAVTLQVKGLQFGHDIQYLTPAEEPMRWQLPRWLFPDTAPEDITARQVTKALVEMFASCPFEIIPPAPLEVPWHNIPPSQHKALRAKLERERKGLPEKPK